MLAFVGLAAAFLPTHRHHRPVQSQLRGGLWRTMCSAPESPDAALDELIRREVEAAFAGIDLESEGELDQLIAEKGDAVMRSVLNKLESDGEQLAATLEDQVAAYTKEQQLAMLRKFDEDAAGVQAEGGGRSGGDASGRGWRRPHVLVPRCHGGGGLRRERRRRVVGVKGVRRAEARVVEKGEVD